MGNFRRDKRAWSILLSAKSSSHINVRTFCSAHPHVYSLQQIPRTLKTRVFENQSMKLIVLDPPCILSVMFLSIFKLKLNLGPIAWRTSAWIEVSRPFKEMLIKVKMKDAIVRVKFPARPAPAG